jgi:hypothetical protein
MKTKFYTILMICVVLIQAACHRGQLSLDPPDSRPVQSIEIADGDEAALIQQQMGIEIQQVQGNRLYYFAVNKNLDDKLTEIGYTIRKENSMQVFYKYVQISVNEKAPEGAKAEELKKTGVLILIKEEKFWIIRGTLEQLKQLQKKGYKLKEMEREPRPREVEVIVPAYEDIQKVNETGMDIYSVEKKERSYTIYGGAFDYQIEKIRDMGFQVTRKK